MALRVIVDSDRCQGHGRCHALAPEVFDLDAVGYSAVTEGLELADDLADLVLRAARGCPERAITVEGEGSATLRADEVQPH